MTNKQDPKVVDYWLHNYLDEETGLCSLCVNTGEIYLEDELLSPGGTIVVGKSRYCLCPNGHGLRVAHGAGKGQKS